MTNFFAANNAMGDGVEETHGFVANHGGGRPAAFCPTSPDVSTLIPVRLDAID